MLKTKTPVLGIIIDGFGISDEASGNPVKKAKMPFYASLLKKYPTTEMFASEQYVGLPKGQMGNSEVGHLNLGAGRCVYQDLMRIDNAILDKSFFENPVFVKQFKRVLKRNSTLHFVGLVSTGGVHSSLNHLLSLIDMANSFGIKKVAVHCITDGRDCTVNSGKGFAMQVEEKLSKLKIGKIVTVLGRFYAMDRENRFLRTEQAFNAMVYGKGKIANNIESVFDVEYEKKTSDEFIVPYVIDGYDGIEKNDEVLFFNFRPDRMRQLAEAFSEKNFDGFKRELPKVNCTSMCMYNENFKNIKVAFMPDHPKQTLSKFLSEKGFSQLKVAETTKYAHVTYYFNGGVEKPYKNEQRILIESENVDNFADYPQMKAFEIADVLVSEISKEKHDLIIVNFANCDMVGHTGNYNACIKALEAVDEALKRVVTVASEVGYTCVITADHGNIEDEKETSQFLTTHTLNPVPVIVTNSGIKLKKGKFGLECFAPTILEIMGVSKPSEMKGESLIK